MLTHRTNRAGYSLLEMIVAGMIFAAVSIALAGVFNYHYRAINSSRLFLVAQHLARTEADQFLAAGWGKIPILVGAPRDVPVKWTIRDQEIETVFKIETSFQDDVSTGHRVCTVTVSWEEGGRTRNVRYSVSISPET